MKRTFTFLVLFLAFIIITGCEAGSNVPKNAKGPYQVQKVIDGDTIKVATRDKLVTVRLLGIQAPELEIHCYANDSKKYLEDLVSEQKVWLETDPSQGTTDKYGRALAYIWLRDGTLVNLRLIDRGAAVEYTYKKKHKYQQKFIDAEKEAAAAGKGAWGRCSDGVWV